LEGSNREGSKEAQQLAQLAFPVFPCKRFILQRGRNNVGLVQGEVAYTIDLGIPQSIAKKGQRIGNLYPRTKVNSVPLNPNKVKSVKRLLEKHYGDQWLMLDSLRHYVNLFYMNAQDVGTPSDDADDNILDIRK
ncbi:hypothetical protein ANN_14164, partial [Periplaneta americana]